MEIINYKKINPEISGSYAVKDGLNLPFRIYFPQNFDIKKKYNAVICIHGGGWHSGIRDNSPWDGNNMSAHAAYYASRGYVGISFSYRSVELAEITLANIIDDCADAFEYIYNKFKFIGKRILLGDSAGGYLAVRFAVSSNEKIRPDFAVACNPVLQITNEFLYAVKGDKSLAKSLSLLNRKIKKCCPILFIHGKNDRIVSFCDSIKMAEILSSKGFDAEIELLNGTDHAFILFDYKYEYETVMKYIKIIDKYIDGKTKGE